MAAYIAAHFSTQRRRDAERKREKERIIPFHAGV